VKLRAETRIDRSAAAITVERNARDGVVHLSVSPTWIGVRTYRDPATGKLSRELRRPEQVWAKSHIDSLKRLTATHGHPTEVWEGEELPVLLDARAAADDPPGPDGTLRRPPAMFQVGQVGDEIGSVEIDGHKLPRVGVAIHGPRAVADAEAGKTQTSLGYGCLVDRTPGKWTDPTTGKVWDYDAEHVLDAEDPRVADAVADGFDPATLGANHLAVSIARGRGGAMSELLPRLDAAATWPDDAPHCITCAARRAVDAASSGGEPGGAPYPPGVPASILLPARARAVADQIAAKLPGSKIAVKADGLELTLPPEIAGPVADVLTAVADYARGMAGELVASDQAAGEQAAALATAKESIDALRADRALVEPLLKAAAKAKRDELIAEAKAVAPKLDVAAIADDADGATIRKLAVTSRLGQLKRDTVDAIDGAYDALVAAAKADTAGGKDPPKPAPSSVIPSPERPTPVPTPRRDEDRGDAEDKLPAMYRTDGE